MYIPLGGKGSFEKNRYHDEKQSCLTFKNSEEYVIVLISPTRITMASLLFMIKNALVLAILLITSISSCQTHKEVNLGSEMVANKADEDREFVNGSKIGTIQLTASRIENLDVLGKVWGYLKYYHPSVAAGEYNWDYELFRILPKILKASDKNERNGILNTWVGGMGSFDLASNDTLEVGATKIRPDFSWINKLTLGEELAAKFKAIENAKRPAEHYYIGQVPRVGNPVFKNEQPFGGLEYPEDALRLLCLFRYWNMIQYFFPYKNLIGEDWNDVLKEFIPKILEASNALQYRTTLLSLIARINDTHAGIWNDHTLDQHLGMVYAPLQVNFVENKAVVVGYYYQVLGEKSGLEIGDVIEEVNGRPISKILDDKLLFTPASNYATKLREIAPSLLRTNDTVLNLVFRREEKRVSKAIETYSIDKVKLYERFLKKPDTCFRMITPTVSYLHLGALKSRFFSKIMPEVQKSKGLIIDLRCYPSDFTVFSLNEFLLPEPTGFVKFSVGSVRSPGLFTMTDVLKAGKQNPDFYKGRVVIIVNEYTQSSAEYHAMAFRTAPNAVVIGSTTAGADGNVSRITLPGRIETRISGIGVYYPDGTDTQRVGIVPDIEVKPTIRGIREKRDELLEKAIEIAMGN